MFAFTMLLFSLQGQVFQEHLQHPDYHFHDVCTDQITGSSEDLIIAGNFFESNFDYPMLEFIRIDATTGNLIWQQSYLYASGVYENVRIFDVVTFTSGNKDQIAATGSITISNINYLFIVTIDGDGNFIEGSYYENIVSGAIHSQGLNIIYTQQGQEGFVVGGFTNMDYDNGTNDITTGFVMRVSYGLDPIWTQNVSTDQPSANYDYDMISDITETENGFFITGSVTSMSTYTQQAILCLKLNLNGDVEWANSYRIGNSRDVGVDAYYDAPYDEIYLLTNYSHYHYFGITVLNASNGDIDLSRSWLKYDFNNLDRYGFKIMESNSDPLSNLVVAGYIRNGSYLDENGIMVFSQTIPFVYEFEKTSGDQIGNSFFYNVPFIDPGFSDYFDFWNGQMPLIYYPDMALRLKGGKGYFITGLRSDASNGYTDVELIRTTNTHENECYNTPVILFQEPIQPTFVSIDIDFGDPSKHDFSLTQITYDYVMDASCIIPVGIIQPKEHNFLIYPNPATNKLHVKIPDQYAVSQYTIFNALGSKVAEGQINTETSVINISTLNEGIYFIRIYYNDQYIVKKVIIDL